MTQVSLSVLFTRSATQYGWESCDGPSSQVSVDSVSWVQVVGCENRKIESNVELL